MTEEQAKSRFMMLNLTRLGGLAFVMAGAANIVGKFLPGLTPFLGYGLLIIGAVDFFAAPILLKRMWRKQDL
jgi:hypothetical protein